MHPSPPAMPLVLDQVDKRYGSRVAVDGLSFTVPAGSICGILGPNGAGKSTTMRMIAGILAPSAGRLDLFGAPPTRASLRRMGYLPEERGLYRAMTPLGAITYLARLRGTPAAVARGRAMAALEAHGLGGFARKRIKTLSKGMAQKVQILAALAHEPDLIVFDEPFSGLDPVNQGSVEALIRAAAAAGKTVLFSTHVMEHAERMCDRIVLIAQGQKAFVGTVQEALGHAPRRAILETEGAFDLAAVLVPQGFRVSAEAASGPGQRRWRVELNTPSDTRRLLGAAVAAGAPLSLFEPTRATLHEAFVALVGERAAPRPS